MALANTTTRNLTLSRRYFKVKQYKITQLVYVDIVINADSEAEAIESAEETIDCLDLKDKYTESIRISDRSLYDTEAL